MQNIRGCINCHNEVQRWNCIGICFIIVVVITAIVLMTECVFGFPWCCNTPELVGDGKCHPLLMNQTICNYDGGDCCEKNATGNRVCEPFNNFPLCSSNYDGGDCRPPNIKEWPKCLHNPSLIADGICDDHLKNKIECNYDGGDCCDEYKLANGKCEGFNNFSTCENYDKGDCRPTSKTEWPGCIFNPQYIADGICFDHFKTKKECNHDGGDCCDEYNLANGKCEGFNNFSTCENYDKGDCRPSSKKEWLNYPFNPDYIGDGICFDHLTDLM